MYVISATPERTRPGPARRIILTAVVIIVAIMGVTFTVFPGFV